MNDNSKLLIPRRVALCAVALATLLDGSQLAWAQRRTRRAYIVTRFSPAVPSPGEEVFVNVRSGVPIRSATVRIGKLINPLRLTVKTPGRTEATGRFRVPRNARFDPYTVRVDTIDLQGRTARQASVLNIDSDRFVGNRGDRVRGNRPETIGVRVSPAHGEAGERMSVIVNSSGRLKSKPTGQIFGMAVPLDFRQTTGSEGRRYVAWFRVPNRTPSGKFQVNVQGRAQNGDPLRNQETFRIVTAQ